MNALAEVPHFVMGEGKEHSESDKELFVCRLDEVRSYRKGVRTVLVKRDSARGSFFSSLLSLGESQVLLSYGSLPCLLVLLINCP